jgi:hypothetical protein
MRKGFEKGKCILCIEEEDAIIFIICYIQLYVNLATVTYCLPAGAA